MLGLIMNTIMINAILIAIFVVLTAANFILSIGTVTLSITLIGGWNFEMFWSMTFKQ